VTKIDDVKKDAESIEKECDHFLGTYREALPRVARRGLQPLLDLLAKLTNSGVVELFRYPLSSAGLRVIDGAESITYGRIVWGPVNNGEMALGFTVRPNVHIPEGILAALGLDAYRIVTLDEIIELGVQPWELVENVKRAAARLEFSLEAGKATQKMAQA
jgi:hypothetical protein